jgi:hypothetical protein
MYGFMDIIIILLRRSSMVEHPTVNRMVVGSSPAAAATIGEE